jgi:predicted nucleotidyltransferase
MVLQAPPIEIITRTIVERFHPRRIILFGSQARGEARPDSDIDLFVEMETVRRPPERAIEISAAFGLRPWAMDVVVYTPGEVARLRSIGGNLLSTIEREGVVLYERPKDELPRLDEQGR